MIYRIGVWRVIGGLVVVLLVSLWFIRGGDGRAVALVKESARRMDASIGKSRIHALVDVSAALALVDAGRKYEPNRARLRRALKGVDPHEYRSYVKRTLDGLLVG